MRILITGSDGFSGSHFVRQAIEVGHQVFSEVYDCSRPWAPNETVWPDSLFFLKDPVSDVPL